MHEDAGDRWNVRSYKQDGVGRRKEGEDIKWVNLDIRYMVKQF